MLLAQVVRIIHTVRIATVREGESNEQAWIGAATKCEVAGTSHPRARWNVKPVTDILPTPRGHNVYSIHATGGWGGGVWRLQWNAVMRDFVR